MGDNRKRLMEGGRKYTYDQNKKEENKKKKE